MPRGEHLPAKAEPFHHAWAKALDEDVVARQQTQERLATFGALEVEHEAALAPIERVEDDVHAVVGLGRHGAQIVASRRILDLVDAGAQVGEDHGRIGPRQKPRQVEHAHVGEGSFIHWLGAPSHPKAAPSVPGSAC